METVAMFELRPPSLTLKVKLSGKSSGQAYRSADPLRPDVTWDVMRSQWIVLGSLAVSVIGLRCLTGHNCLASGGIIYGGNGDGDRGDI
jgi:hypothetical protein